MPLTVTYEGYTFTAQGHTWFDRKSRQVSDLPHLPPYQATVKYQVKQTFLEPSFADNQAQYARLLAALGTLRGTLTILDENGTQLFSDTVNVDDHDLPAQWGQNLLEVTVGFTGIDNLSQAWTGNDAAYTPAGAPAEGGAVALRNVVGFKESLRASRYSPLVPNRRETTGTVILEGRIHVNPDDPPQAQQAYLLAQKNLIESCADSPSGTLVFATFSRPVQIEGAQADVKDGTQILEWSLTATYLRFPAGDYVETDYKVQQKDDKERKERITTVAGAIRAYDQAAASLEMGALDAVWAVAPRVRRKQDFTARSVAGEDSGETATFVEADFALEYREPLPGSASYTLTVTTRNDVRSGYQRLTYAGKAWGPTGAAALAQARTCGLGKSPILADSSEAVQTNDVEGADYFVEVTFSYEYLTRGAWQYAEVTSAADNPSVGNATQTVSGVAIAATQALALALARSFQLAGPGAFLQTNRETAENISSSDFTAGDGLGTGQPPTAALHVKVDFSYGYFLGGPVSGALQYSQSTSEDFSTRTATNEIAGTCYAAAGTVADALIAALWAELIGLPGAWKITYKTTDQNETANGQTIYKGTTFSLSTGTPLAASGDDILESSYSVETTFSVSKTVITPIPYGSPYVQQGVGTVPGSRTVSGSITSLNPATAVSWARARYPAQGYAEAPREHFHTVFYPLSGTSIKAYKMDFTYAMAWDSYPFNAGSTTA